MSCAFAPMVRFRSSVITDNFLEFVIECDSISDNSFILNIFYLHTYSYFKNYVHVTRVRENQNVGSGFVSVRSKLSILCFIGFRSYLLASPSP